MERVLPRDAFNDANLLKCIGRLTMMIEDGEIPWLRYEYDGQPFDIQQDASNGSTYVSNLTFYTTDGSRIVHERQLNSRDAWPLELYIGDAGYYAFSENGEFLMDRENPPQEEGA